MGVACRCSSHLGTFVVRVVYGRLFVFPHPPTRGFFGVALCVRRRGSSTCSACACLSPFAILSSTVKIHSCSAWLACVPCQNECSLRRRERMIGLIKEQKKQKHKNTKREKHDNCINEPFVKFSRSCRVRCHVGVACHGSSHVRALVVRVVYGGGGRSYS